MVSACDVLALEYSITLKTVWESVGACVCASDVLALENTCAWLIDPMGKVKHVPNHCPQLELPWHP
jgi:hypothetical protein